MNIRMLHVRIEALRAIADDSEEAHVEEDRIHYEVLQAIANGADNVRELAALALTAT